MTNKSNHAGLGIALGAALGAVAGVMAGHIAIWLGIGIAIGMLLSASVRGKQNDCPECAAIHRRHETKNRNENQRLAAGS
jgi:hypothetical protein